MELRQLRQYCEEGMAERGTPPFQKAITTFPSRSISAGRRVLRPQFREDTFSITSYEEIKKNAFFIFPVGFSRRFARNAIKSPNGQFFDKVEDVVSPKHVCSNIGWKKKVAPKNLMSCGCPGDFWPVTGSVKCESQKIDFYGCSYRKKKRFDSI